MNIKVSLTSKWFVLAASSLTLIVAGLLVYFLVFAGSTGPTPDSPEGRLAACLSDQGVTMYGLPTCPHCQDQKDKFGDAFRYVDYVNCSKNRDECLNQGIETVPAWIIDGEMIVGVRELEELANKAGCEYP